MNETRLWYCNICDKSVKIKNKTKHIKCKSYKQKNKFKVVVKEYEFSRPDNNKLI